MAEKRLYSINEIIKDAKIARSTFDKFAERNKLRPVKTEKRGKKFYTLADKELVVNHYLQGQGKEEKEKFTNHKKEKHDEIIELLKDQIHQLQQANEQVVNDNNILENQLKSKDSQINELNERLKESHQLQAGLEQKLKMLPDSNEKEANIVDAETVNSESKDDKENHSATEKRGFWSRLFGR